MHHREEAVEVASNVELGERLVDLSMESRANRAWRPPLQFDLASEEGQQGVTQLIDNTPGIKVVDNVEPTVEDLFEIQHPSLSNDESAREDFLKDIESQGVEYGQWFYFPWAEELVRYPEKEAHQLLRTARNRELITREEQEILLSSTLLVAGLSVGSNVVESYLLTGIGGKLIIADMDALAPSNLNRIRGDMSQVGNSKVDLIAQRISRADPYVEQVHLHDGMNEAAMKAVIEDHSPHVLVDEVDDIKTKAMMRSYAQSAGIPLLMATDVGDTSLVDVERHDLGDCAPFNGLLETADIERLLDERPLTPEERGQFLLKVVGAEHITERIADSLQKQGKELAGLPQLGGTAVIGGSLLDRATREILLDRNLSSGRYDSPDQITQSR